MTGDAVIEEARSAPLDEAALRDKLGDSPFELGALDITFTATIESTPPRHPGVRPLPRRP